MTTDSDDRIALYRNTNKSVIREDVSIKQKIDVDFDHRAITLSLSLSRVKIPPIPCQRRRKKYSTKQVAIIPLTNTPMVVRRDCGTASRKMTS